MYAIISSPCRASSPRNRFTSQSSEVKKGEIEEAEEEVDAGVSVGVSAGVGASSGSRWKQVLKEWREGAREVMMGSSLNVLLVFVPITIVAAPLHAPQVRTGGQAAGEAGREAGREGGRDSGREGGMDCAHPYSSIGTSRRASR